MKFIKVFVDFIRANPQREFFILKVKGRLKEWVRSIRSLDVVGNEVTFIVEFCIAWH